MFVNGGVSIFFLLSFKFSKEAKPSAPSRGGDGDLNALN